METNKANSGKEDKDRNKSRMQSKPPKGEPHPSKEHTSQGHTAGAEGSATSSKEPTLRGSTTDSSRTHKNPHDDMPTGGNIR